MSTLITFIKQLFSLNSTTTSTITKKLEEKPCKKHYFGFYSTNNIPCQDCGFLVKFIPD